MYEKGKIKVSPQIRPLLMHTESYVYFVVNTYNNVLYVGVNSELIRRIYEHKNRFVKVFIQKYNVENHKFNAQCLLHYQYLYHWD
jgi:predicted GIY-YIG superfamily endonuclease